MSDLDLKEPHAMGGVYPFPRKDEGRFWSKVDRAGAEDCWNWSGCKVRGYGRFWAGGKGILAHRATFIMANGPFPEGLCADHLCRNKSCVNPAHLEAVTPQENTRRGLAGQHMKDAALVRTHCRAGHPFIPENIYYTKRGYRHCRECSMARRRKSHAKTRAAARAARVLKGDA